MAMATWVYTALEVHYMLGSWYRLNVQTSVEESKSCLKSTSKGKRHLIIDHIIGKNWKYDNTNLFK